MWVMPALPVPTASASAPEAAHDNAPAFSPLYQQIKELITRRLQGGEWLPGQSIPSEMELAARFRVSQGTVRKAVDELATENLLVRRQGKGTFVATHAEERTQYRFLRLMSDAGGSPGLQRRLIGCRRQRVAADAATVAARAAHPIPSDLELAGILRPIEPSTPSARRSGLLGAGA